MPLAREQNNGRALLLVAGNAPAVSDFVNAAQPVRIMGAEFVSLSLYRPVADVEGSLTENFNKTGVRVWATSSAVSQLARSEAIWSQLRRCGGVIPSPRLGPL